MSITLALEVIIMYRSLWIIFVTAFFYCCSLNQEKLAGESIYFKHKNDDVFWENIVGYGRFQKEVLQKPTSVYHSAFGHGYCMSEEVTFEAKKYLKGTGSDLIEFAQNKIDYYRPIAEDIGFSEAVLFLSKNEHRGIWSTRSVRIDNFEGESRIYRPIDIMHFLSFENLESLHIEYKEPFEWGVEIGLLSEQNLDKLKGKGILSYRPDPQDKNGNLYLLEMYKYISVEALLSNDF
ncbi:hypothetical protein [Microbulbifer spongiae]|uniref:Uncharacterized protein n=1 Tax=Microbulbifer spongiae TaxID=2944933 RepID=A0ABY9EE26_9GAMM|nr:hypothetical protein [Microbulbifer sp. MI-G]WKD49610.1 hypothetical protein M8T91_17235 [Microbulbifer sp. MI-G]